MVTVLATQLVVGASSITLNYNSTISTVDQMMSETAVLAAERIEQELTAYKNVAMDTGCISQLLDETVSLEEKRSIIDERVSMHDFQRGNIIGPDGISIFDGKDYSDREYVKQAMQGNVYVSEPLISKITGELSIMVAAPIYKNGIQGADIEGVVYFVPHETFLNDIVSSIRVSEHNRAYMINRSGDTIADTTLDTITVQNIENEAQSDSSLKELASIHADSTYGFSVYSNSDHFGVHPACTAEYAQEINVVELFAFRALAVFAEKRKFFGFGAEVMEEFGDIEADNVNEARLLRQFADRQ